MGNFIKIHSGKKAEFIKPIESGLDGVNTLSNLEIGKVYVLTLLHAYDSYYLEDIIQSGANIIYATRVVGVNDDGVHKNIFMAIFEATSTTVKFSQGNGSNHWAYTCLK